MTKRIPPTEAVQMRQDFQDELNMDDLAFVRDKLVAVYGFLDDPASLEYAAYLKLLFPGRSLTHSIDLSKPDGGVQVNHVRGRKVIACSHKYEQRYADFLSKRFSKLEDQKIVRVGDVRYVTADPYDVRQIEKLPVDPNGSNNPRNGYKELALDRS